MMRHVHGEVRTESRLYDPDALSAAVDIELISSPRSAIIAPGRLTKLRARPGSI
jgi:hypothetical protein